MPELVLSLRTDPISGKRQLVVSYRSDADALPNEHEEEHRRLVQKLVEKGGRVIVRRETEEAPAGAQESTPQGERESVRQKG